MLVSLSNNSLGKYPCQQSFLEDCTLAGIQVHCGLPTNLFCRIFLAKHTPGMSWQRNKRQTQQYLPSFINGSNQTKISLLYPYQHHIICHKSSVQHSGFARINLICQHILVLRVLSILLLIFRDHCLLWAINRI